MLIASEFGNYDDRHNLPTANKSAYALASAMAKTDEEGDRRCQGFLNQIIADRLRETTAA